MSLHSSAEVSIRSGIQINSHTLTHVLHSMQCRSMIDLIHLDPNATPKATDLLCLQNQYYAKSTSPP